MAGYSRLMGDDELATVRTLSEYRDAFGAIVAARGGRVVDSPGDNILSEFGSAVDAVEAALAVQSEIGTRNSSLPDGRRMHFRIGVNLGDLVVDGEKIYGDGVNIAARIEALAYAGGICVSGKVHDEVKSKLNLSFEDLGPHTLKNIASPVRVFRVPTGNSASPAKPAAPVARQARPSIIVLPFVNMSGATEQEYFADGLTEDILTYLSRFRELVVISRNTSFKYKGQAVDVKKVASELGVQYVAEGSVRRSGNRVRVTVQLIDAAADNHVWAERYDRDLEDIFAIQDEITSSIVATLPGRLEAAARGRNGRQAPSSMAAWECLLEAKVLHHRSNKADNARAQSLAERALELDPDYAHAHAWKACILGQQWGYGWCADRDATKARVVQELEIALVLDDNDSDVHRILAAIALLENEHDKAVYHQQRALNLNPNDDLIVVQQGEILTWHGKAGEGADWIRKAMRLNPYHPLRFWSHLGRAYFVARRYDEALEALGNLTAADAATQVLMAACHAQAGNLQSAAHCVREALQRESGFNWPALLLGLHYRHETDLAHHRDAAMKAGLPA